MNLSGIDTTIGALDGARPIKHDTTGFMTPEHIVDKSHQRHQFQLSEPHELKPEHKLHHSHPQELKPDHKPHHTHPHVPINERVGLNFAMGAADGPRLPLVSGPTDIVPSEHLVDKSHQHHKF